MSIKIKINWDNDNAVSELVRIYRADSLFTTATQVMLIATIVGDVYEYEDFDVIENQTYFYMLSVKLDAQEVFTECFEVKASAEIWLDTSAFMTESQRRANNYHAATATLSVSSLFNQNGVTKWAGVINLPDGRVMLSPYSRTIRIVNIQNDEFADFADAGGSKFCGSALAKNNCVYFAPHQQSQAAKLDLSTMTMQNFGVVVPGSYRYFGCVLANNDKAYCIPAGVAQILVINTIDDTTYTISATSGYRSAVFAQNGKIYFIPFSAASVMCLDTNDDSITYFGSFSGANKWWGGVLGADGKIYCAPANSNKVLIIDTTTNTAVETDFSLTISTMVLKYAGGVLGADGKIYFVPFNAGNFLIIDIVTQTAEINNSWLPSSYGNVQAFFGGCLASDGKIYLAPHSSNTYSSNQLVTISSQEYVTTPSLKYCLSPHINKI